jgi:hypothetical protein
MACLTFVHVERNESPIRSRMGHAGRHNSRPCSKQKTERPKLVSTCTADWTSCDNHLSGVLRAVAAIELDCHEFIQSPSNLWFLARHGFAENVNSRSVMLQIRPGRPEMEQPRPRRSLILFQPRSNFVHPARRVFAQTWPAEMDALPAVIAEVALDRVAVRAFERDAVFP